VSGLGNDERWSESSRVVVLARSEWSVEIVAALRRAGFDVDAAADVPGMVGLVGREELFVAIVDDREPNWVRQVSDLVRHRPGARPLVLAEVEGPAEILAALSVGVAGFVPPNASAGAIVRSVRSIFLSGVSIPRGMVPVLVDSVRNGHGHSVDTPTGPIDLTGREWEILQLLLQRRTTREMAATLFVSVGTVRSHVSTLLRKVGAEDRDELVSLVEHPGRRSAS
jgi:DNA-binding NarL/FixJ family response regulator